MKLHLIAAALVMLATPAFAQTPAAPAAPPPDKTFTSAADIQAMIASAAAQPPKSIIAQPILSLAPYSASLEYRKGPPSNASVHTVQTELMYVVEGSGTLIVGGTLHDGKQTNETNLSGPSIDGGTSVKLAKGDFTIIPENTPHQLVPDDGVALVMMTYKSPRPIPGQ